MACETLSREINGQVFKVTQLPGTRAYTLMVRLFGLVAPAAASALGKAEDMSLKKLMEMNLSSLADGIETLASNLTPEVALEVLKTLLENSTVNDKPLMPMFDTILAGKMFTVLKLLKFALEVNYSDFFGTSLAP